MKYKTRYNVVVSGSVLDSSDDSLIADRMAFHYREMGCKDVKVVKNNKRR